MRKKIDILSEVAEVLADRQRSYGPPDQHWQATANMISIWLKRKYGTYVPLTAADWAMFMVLDKAVREANQSKHDNHVDIIGYTAGRDALGKEPR